MRDEDIFESDANEIKKAMKVRYACKKCGELFPKDHGEFHRHHYICADDNYASPQEVFDTFELVPPWS